MLTGRLILISGIHSEFEIGPIRSCKINDNPRVLKGLLGGAVERAKVRLWMLSPMLSRFLPFT